MAPEIAAAARNKHVPVAITGAPPSTQPCEIDGRPVAVGLLQGKSLLLYVQLLL
jgi:hypothetical protein